MPDARPPVDHAASYGRQLARAIDRWPVLHPGRARLRILIVVAAVTAATFGDPSALDGCFLWSMF